MNEPDKDGMVLIDVADLEELQADARFLNCLYSAGVDSWEGYEAAQEMLES